MANEERKLLELLAQRKSLNEQIDTLECELYQCGNKSVKDYREQLYKPFKRLQKALEPAGFSVVNLYKLDPCGISCGYYLIHVARKRIRLYNNDILRGI